MIAVGAQTQVFIEHTWFWPHPAPHAPQLSGSVFGSTHSFVQSI
jgi:hypothetical protein